MHRAGGLWCPLGSEREYCMAEAFGPRVGQDSASTGRVRGPLYDRPATTRSARLAASMVARNVPEDDGVARLTSPQHWGCDDNVHLLPSSAASAPPTSSNVARAVGGFHEFARAPLLFGAARATRDGLQQPPPPLASGSTARNANWQPPQPLQSSFAQRPPACQNGRRLIVSNGRE